MHFYPTDIPTLCTGFVAVSSRVTGKLSRPDGARGQSKLLRDPHVRGKYKSLSALVQSDTAKHQYVVCRTLFSVPTLSYYYFRSTLEPELLMGNIRTGSCCRVL